MSSDKGKKIDHLKEDDPISRQNYVCISFVSPEGIKGNSSTRGLKIRGTYQTYEEAQERCKELQITDQHFDIFIGEVGKWLPWDPDPNTSKDQKFQEQELQELVDGYKKNLSQKAKVEEQRKEQMIKNAANDPNSRKQRKLDKLRKKHQDNKRQEEPIDLLQESQESQGSHESDEKQESEEKQKSPINIISEDKEKELEKRTDLAKKERERIYDNKKKLEQQQSNIESIDDKLARIQEIYNNLNKKTKQVEKTDKE